MKIYKRIIFNITILSFIFSAILYINTYAQSIGCIKGYNVNIRSAASKDSEIITRLDNNQILEVNGFENNFFKVNLDNKECYISKDFLEISKADCEIIGDNVNIREFPSQESQIIGKLSNSEKVFITGKKDSWYLIEFNGAYGFINKNFVSTELGEFTKETENVHNNENDKKELYAVVKSDTGLRLREEASVESNVIKVIPSGNTLDVLDIDNNWVKVSYSNEYGYVSADYINVTTDLPKVEEPIVIKEKSKDIISYAKNFLGVPYSWGGTNLKSGVDCSGFVYSVFKKFGINLNRSSSDMIKNGANINRSQLKEGDLVFFNTSGRGISHVGIYLGNGNFIHSSSKRKQGVTINNLNEGYYQRTFVGATRVL